MKAERSVSKTGKGKSWEPKAIVSSRAPNRIGIADFSKVPALTRVRSLESDPPIRVGSGICLISKKEESVH